MNATLRHRGPDSEGELVDGPAGMAMRRLAIIDLAGGDQPIANEDGTVHVVANAEVYDHRDHRRELRGRGHAFATESDVEVVVHLYEERGLGFAEALRGMFAVALWDARRGRMVLARDRFGIKPLYYSVHGERLAFASELSALTRVPGFSRELDLSAVEAYLAFNSIPAPMTVYRQARKLPPGHLLTWEDGRVRVERWARPAPVRAEGVRRERPSELAAE